MWLVGSILVLFVLFTFMAVVEDRIEPRLKWMLYYGFGFVLVLLAGCREIGVDPDSLVYEQYFMDCENMRYLLSVEYSYLYLSQLLRTFTDDVHSIFLIYAFFGVLLKLKAMREYSTHAFLVLLVYISYFFELHETCQIRTGVISALMLFIIYYVAQKKRLKAFLLILLASVFHISALSFVILLFFGNKPLGRKWVIFLAVSIPVSYVVGVFFSSISAMLESIPYIGNKLTNYQESAETALIQVQGVNPYSPFHLFQVMVFYYLLYFRNTIARYDKYYPILIKALALGLVFYTAFASLPVLGERLGALFKMATMILIVDIVYTIRPRRYGVLAVALVAFVYLNYVMRSMYDFTLILS